MRLGLKRDTVEVVKHDPNWAGKAAEVVEQLWHIFGTLAVDIQHIGSTAIPAIKAKPIIDITVAIWDFELLDELLPALEASGIDKSPGQLFEDVILFSVDDADGKRVYNIIVVKHDSKQRQNYINFRDYMNKFPEKAMAYDELKSCLSKEYPKDIIAYMDGKRAFVEGCLFDTNIKTN